MLHLLRYTGAVWSPLLLTGLNDATRLRFSVIKNHQEGQERAVKSLAALSLRYRLFIHQPEAFVDPMLQQQLSLSRQLRFEFVQGRSHEVGGYTLPRLIPFQSSRSLGDNPFRFRRRPRSPGGRFHPHPKLARRPDAIFWNTVFSTGRPTEVFAASSVTCGDMHESPPPK